MYNITLIPGDGIGKEVTDAMKKVVEATGIEINWEEVVAGESVVSKYNTPLPDYVIDSIKKNKIAIKGPITTPVGKGFRSVNVALRKTLNLYANVRPIKSFKGIKSRYEDVDLTIIRENTEGLYSGIEHMVGDEAGESIKIITKKATDNIVNFACDYTKNNGYKKLTCVHKANIMKISDGLFLREFYDVCDNKDIHKKDNDNKNLTIDSHLQKGKYGNDADEFDIGDIDVKHVKNRYGELFSEKLFLDKRICCDDMIVDACAMNLVLDPKQFDVLVMPNLYGDILSDLGAGLVGGLGIIPSANIGDEYAVFEAVHGTAPQIAGKNIANPTAIIQSAIMMLKYINEYLYADMIENALKKVFEDGNILTQDLGGNATTEEFTNAIIEKMTIWG